MGVAERDPFARPLIPECFILMMSRLAGSVGQRRSIDVQEDRSPTRPVACGACRLDTRRRDLLLAGTDPMAAGRFSDGPCIFAGSCLHDADCRRWNGRLCGLVLQAASVNDLRRGWINR